MIPNRDSIVVSPTEPTVNRRKVWMQKGKNLLDLSNISSETLNGVTITKNENGSITLNGTSTTGFSIQTMINLTLESGTYTHSVTNKVTNIFFSLNNIEETMIGRLDALETSITFTLNEKTNYFNYHIWINSGATFSNYTFYPMIYQGSEATVYENYIEPKIYVKNDNDVYENFTNKDEEIYSTSEQLIGRWINGKPLYRRTFKTTTPTVASNGTDVLQQVYMNNVDFGYITNIFMEINTTASLNYVNIFWRGSDSKIRCNYLVNKQYQRGIIEIVSNDTTNNNRDVYVTVEYTKSTD